MSTRPLALIALLLAACSSNVSSIRAEALENADVLEREMDLLYQCGLEESGARSLEIERSDDNARVYQTEWVADGIDRWRLTVLVQVHPRFGPGAHAIITRDRWVGGEPIGDLAESTLPAIEPETRGWVRARGNAEDTALSSEVGTGIRLCWDARSELGGS